MGKSYVENSLKRFLKRKVKITLGVVVTFLITGAVAFADTTVNTSRGEIVVPVGYENQIVVGAGNKIIIESGKEIHKVFPVSEEMKKLFENSWETKGAAVYAIDGAIIENDGNMSFRDENNKNKVAGEIALYNGSTFINRENGVVDRVWSEDSEVYNYGKIATNLMQWSTFISKGKTDIYNYGEIQGGSYVMYFSAGQQNLYNYGLIKSNPNSKGGDGENLLTFADKEFITEDKFLNVYNYGTLEGYRTLFKFRPEKDTNVKIYNYNLIKNTKNTPEPKNQTLYIDKKFNGGYQLINYGLIDVHGTAFKVKGFENYGVLKEKYYFDSVGGEVHKVFDNKGIYITSSNLKSPEKEGDKIEDKIKNISGEQRGAILIKENDKYTLLNGEKSEAKIKIKDMSGEKEINSTNTADNMFINNKSLKLNLGETVKDKVITAVSQTKGNVVLDNDNKEGNENLTLDNTTIVGYFEEDGTLLKVDGDLTLGNNSIINAVAKRDDDGNILTEAVAVEVKGNLTYTEGENHIFGIIKGGENSEITVKPEENIPEGESSSLNEDIKTSGQLTLEGEEWTKGQGSITLEGDNAEVNIGKDGTGTLNMGRMRFNLGNLDIGGLEDTFTIEGSDGKIKVEDVINKIDVSGIFKKEIKDGDLVLSLKSAEEMGIYDPAKQKQYEELVKNFKDTEELYNLVNNGNEQEIKKYLGVLDAIIELLGTSGVKITRDLTGAFTDAVVEFDKKADKGQWLTNAKYIGSDMEYDGTKNINGYDSDIKSMVGMAEYGITENTSLGFALGGGDTEVDLKTLNGKSTSFDGNNYYAGIYAKHSVNGFDMTGSLGYTISDLDVKNGGSADSKAFTLAGYIKRDVKLADTVKLEPNVSFIYDYIMQDKAEMGEGMTIDSGDYHVFEAGAGLNLVKEFAFEKGSLKLKTGVKYSMVNVERNQEVTGNFYNARVNLGSPDIDDTYGKANIGFDYEHVSGFGVNGKYETMWSDSEDDSRITAGISYRF